MSGLSNLTPWVANTMACLRGWAEQVGLDNVSEHVWDEADEILQTYGGKIKGSLEDTPAELAAKDWLRVAPALDAVLPFAIGQINVEQQRKNAVALDVRQFIKDRAINRRIPRKGTALQPKEDK